MQLLRYIALWGVLYFISPNIEAQDFLKLKGQLSAYTNINYNNAFPLWNGGRYIPQANFNILKGSHSLIDFEAAANIYGDFGLKDFNNTRSNGNIKPYRVWARYSTNQFELRGGLQKINFGSSTILRPLMWFDQLDPRDPLQLTDGVWGILARYYFLNNANIWLWSLHGNKDLKGWEMLKTARDVPEIGGRVQYPVNTGEAALSYHYRVTDSREFSEIEFQSDRIPEHRIGFDAKFDWVIGCWIETSWKRLDQNVGRFTNQELVNLGVDYTFGLGNGLNLVYEQLLAAYDEKAFRFNNPVTYSLLSASYPVGFFDNLNLILYFDWQNKATYNFVNWQKQLNKLTLHVMGYVNPTDYNIPTQQGTENLYAGTGVQVMLVFNH